MNWLKSPYQDCLCAFCSSPRRIARKRHLNLLNIIYSLLLAVVLMWAFWQEFDGRVFLLFVLNLTVAEAFVQVRWRLSIACNHCGFDPILYLQSQEKAAQKVKDYRLKLQQRADYWLRTDPLKAAACREKRDERDERDQSKDLMVSG